MKILKGGINKRSAVEPTWLTDDSVPFPIVDFDGSLEESRARREVSKWQF